MLINNCDDYSCLCHTLTQNELVNFIKNHKLDVLEILDFNKIMQKALEKQKKELNDEINKKLELNNTMNNQYKEYQTGEFEKQMKQKEEEFERQMKQKEEEFERQMKQNKKKEQDTELEEKHKEELRLLEAKLTKEQMEKDKLQKCLDIKEKEINGSHSMYKGEYRELHQEIVAERLYGDTYEVEGKKKMHCMDIRLKHKTYSFIVGLETKEKKTLTAHDIKKFHTDRLNNEFQAGIMLSTQGPIKGFVKEPNSFKITENELYIYSNDGTYIGIIIGCFLHMTEQKFLREKAACENAGELYEQMKAKYEITTEHAIAMYNKWQKIQKANVDFDKQMMIGLVQMGVPPDIFKGHRYVVSLSKCKGTKHPYGLRILQ